MIKQEQKGLTLSNDKTDNQHYRQSVAPIPLLFGATLLIGCASPKLPNNQTAADAFYRLGYHEKTVARDFYDLGEGDAVKRLYWAQRRAQETGYRADNGIRLQRKYVQIPVPENVQPDGTIQEAHQTVVEIVQ